MRAKEGRPRGPLPRDVHAFAALAMLRCSQRIALMALAAGNRAAATVAAGEAVAHARRSLGPGASGSGAARRLLDRISADGDALPGSPLRRSLAGMEAMARGLERRLPPLPCVVARGAEAAAEFARGVRGMDQCGLALLAQAALATDGLEEGIQGPHLRMALRLAPLQTAAISGVHAAAAMVPAPSEAPLAVSLMDWNQERRKRKGEPAFPSAEEVAAEGPEGMADMIGEAGKALQLPEISHEQPLDCVSTMVPERHGEAKALARALRAVAARSRAGADG